MRGASPGGYATIVRKSIACEDGLIKCGRADDACHRYGLKTATGPILVPTYLAFSEKLSNAIRDRCQVLLDLRDAAERGRWFAAAKEPDGAGWRLNRETEAVLTVAALANPAVGLHCRFHDRMP
jgi:hypothetical protein